MPLLRDAEGGKGLKILTPNKLLSRLQTLAQIKAGNDSNKLKNEI